MESPGPVKRGDLRNSIEKRKKKKKERDAFSRRCALPRAKESSELRLNRLKEIRKILSIILASCAQHIVPYSYVSRCKSILCDLPSLKNV